ncbi:hypothetical protein GCM10011416_23270 [Polaribacter pacificus]|uniref:DUF3822 domain-containing protein n=1 Tax=Polaribacter pacificus TaxID=1775173 RepID=A0A917I1G2_9FLAO|nr:hypothetical protein GCM10011416_23270 [Polaribacter pacificus]
MDGFSFCISNLATQEIFHFESHPFKQSCANPVALLTEIEKITKESAILNQDFESVVLIHQNNLATLVPSTLFDKEQLSTYLTYTVKTFSTDYIAYDSLEQAAINNVYVPYVNINNFFFQKYGAFEYKHQATVLIDKLLLHAKNTQKDHFYVHVEKKQIEIIVLKDGQLHLYNSFSYETKEDVLYYILFTAEQLELNPEEFELSFTGWIDKDSELYTFAYQYVRNITFLEIKNDFFEQDKTLNAYNYYINIP